MNPEIKRQWLDRLRSGEYVQTKFALKDREGYCCLGVLCEVAVDNNAIKYYPGPNWGYAKNDLEFLRSKGTPPKEVAFWAGLDAVDPIVQYDGEEYRLARLNDIVELTFEEIADLIEEQL